MIAMKSKNVYLHDSRMNINYTHCEIHPSTIFGVVASCIPYPDHNQSPRNTYQCAQAKQAMGIYTTSFKKRMDTLAYILHYPQKSLVNTMNSKYIHSEDIPAGQTAIVAIATYMGYNQEDSLIMNRDSIQRGMFRSKSIKRYQTSAEKNQSTAEDSIFMKPDINKVVGMRHGSYDKLNDKGYVPEET